MEKQIESMESHFDNCASNYDQHSINDLGMKEFYDEIERLIVGCKYPKHILVLGCGTGLEVERIKHDAIVTAIDISPEMIKKLKQKTLTDGVKLRPVCVNYLNIMFTNDKFDLILTTNSFHHLNREQKLAMYQKIYKWLKPNGFFMNGDIVAKDKEEETKYLEDAKKIYKENNKPFGSLHIDTPLTLETEEELMKEAGFIDVAMPRRWSETVIIKTEKPGRKTVTETAEETDEAETLVEEETAQTV